ncbi:hypothetical protein EB796_003040 [Bugula neritina]|uniref:Uncharacterized protein n=1 Tax=Bugula neritina TaxID=10212 RepID=A0A7J7KIW2_BUGNE|nr:hypothetical protein EB796_003040 [Bugula neritina]
MSYKQVEMTVVMNFVVTMKLKVKVKIRSKAILIVPVKLLLRLRFLLCLLLKIKTTKPVIKKMHLLKLIALILRSFHSWMT